MNQYLSLVPMVIFLVVVLIFVAIVAFSGKPPKGIL